MFHASGLGNGIVNYRVPRRGAAAEDQPREDEGPCASQAAHIEILLVFSSKKKNSQYEEALYRKTTQFSSAMKLKVT